MRKRIVKFLVVIGLLSTLMFAEYRFIMRNIVPTVYEDGYLCLEVFGQVDQYYVGDLPE